MSTTYAKWEDLTVGSIVDGEIVTDREVWSTEAPGDPDSRQTFVRLTTHTGGRRTERSTFPLNLVNVQHVADPRLVNASDKDMAAGVEYFVEWISLGEADNYPALLDGLHGLALELHRRRTLDAMRVDALNLPARETGTHL